MTPVVAAAVVFFFFSSRRRHTRCSRDWSSDVCSSDLEALLAEMDDLVIDLTATAVERYRHEIGDLIAQTVAGWDPEATSRRFELAVGRDLQFVRINGTLVGGLVGLAIYTVSQLLR